MASATRTITPPPEIPGLTNSALHREFIQRLVNGRDMRVYITADNAATGVGKTTLAVVLAKLWDQHGWNVDKATLDPREFSAIYDEVPPGSVLILDEAEQAAEARRATSKENVVLSHEFATKRYRQVFGIMTLPTKSMLDNRISDKLSDFWIQCQETPDGVPKGEAKVYRLGTNDHFETDFTKKTEVISWPQLDSDPDFDALTAKKVERMEGRARSNYVHRDEVEELKKNYWNKATKMARYHLVKSMAVHGISQTKIAEILTDAEHVEGLSQQRVSQFVNSASFEEVYST